jgi:hypothetical protein
MSENITMDARKKIEALETVLGVRLPRDRPITIEFKDDSEVDLDHVVGGVSAPQSWRTTLTLDWRKAVFRVTTPDI